MEQDADGNVTQTIYLPYNVAELCKAGLDYFSAAEIANNLKSEFDTYFLNKYINFETRLDADTTLTESDKEVMKSCCPTIDDLKGKGYIFGNSDKSGIIYTLEFKNVIAYYYFNMNYNYTKLIEELNKDDSITKEHFFSKDVVNSGTSIYGAETDLSSELTFSEYVTYSARQILRAKGMSDEKIESIVPKQYIYRYGTSSKRLHSNADKVFTNDGMYYHEWTIDVENSTREIITWRTYAKTNVWYISALCLTIALVGILSVMAIIDGKKQKNKENIG